MRPIRVSDLIYCNNAAIHLLDEIEFFVFEVLQGDCRCHLRAGICKYWLYVKIIKDPESSFTNTSIEPTLMCSQQLSEMKNGFIPPIYHI